VNIAWFIAKRIMLPKQKTFSSFIIRLCIVATAISVAVMVLSTALFDGFEQAISNKFLNSWGNLQVMTFDESGGNNFQQQSELVKDDSLLTNLKSVSGVKQISVFALQSTVFKTKKEIQGGILKGVDKDFDWQRLQQFLVKGKTISFKDSGYSRQIILSQYQANKLNVDVGDSIINYFVQSQGEAPRAKKLEICGIYETGLIENDKLFSFADIDLLHQIKYDSAENIFGYEISLHNPKLSEQVQKIMQEKYVSAPLEVYRTEQRFSYIFQWLALIKSDLSIIYIIMLIVAVMNIISGVLILILERTQMIGILKSVGAQNKSIQSVFFWQSIFICGIGIALGIVIAVALCLLQKYYPFVKLDPKVYYVNYVQVQLDVWKIVKIAIGTLLVCGVLLIIPTLLVQRIQPIKALRFD
jgi:lipoprotein-releasing system permease protein